MRRLIFILLIVVLVSPGCISSVSSPSKKNYRLPRESMRKHFGAHSELAMVLGPAETVQQKLKKEIAGEDGVHPAFAKKFDTMIATFDDKVVEAILANILKNYFTDADMLALSDYLATEKGQNAVHTLNEQLIEFDPPKTGPALIVAKALGPFVQTKAGKKWVKFSPKVQQEFTKTVKVFSIQETRKIIGIGTN